MTKSRIALALTGWTAGVAWFFFYWNLRVDPQAPCNDVFTRFKPVCTASSPVDVDAAYVAIAVAVWASGILVGFVALRLYRRARRQTLYARCR